MSDSGICMLPSNETREFEIINGKNFHLRDCEYHKRGLSSWTQNTFWRHKCWSSMMPSSVPMRPTFTAALIHIFSWLLLYSNSHGGSWILEYLKQQYSWVVEQCLEPPPLRIWVGLHLTFFCNFRKRIIQLSSPRSTWPGLQRWESKQKLYFLKLIYFFTQLFQ